MNEAISSVTQAIRKGNQFYDGSKGVYLYPFVKENDLVERLLTTSDGATTVLALALLYANCGVDGLQTAASNANSIKLNHAGFDGDQSQLLSRRSAIITKTAADMAGGNIWVAGSIMPIGKTLTLDYGDADPEEVANAHRKQIRGLEEGGADVIALETFYSLKELQLLLETVEQETDLPVMLTMTFDPKYNSDRSILKFHRTLFGISPADLMELARNYKSVIACGANCGVGPDTAAILMGEHISAQNFDNPIPLIAKLNAGSPPNYASPKEMTDYARAMQHLGVPVIGGCCGTGVEHLLAIGRELGKETRGWTGPITEMVNRIIKENPPQYQKMLRELGF